MWHKFQKVLLIIHPLICFPLFGLGCAVLCFFVFPLIHLTSRDKHRAQHRVRSLISQGFSLFLWILKLTGRINVSIEGEDILTRTKPALILANHPTLIDVILLISRIPQATCIVKGGLIRNPIFRSGIRSAGYIYGSTEQEAVHSAVHGIKGGQSLVIFPEGTRSDPQGLGKFKRGAATIALESGRPIIPVIINVSPPFLTKGQKWRDFSKLTSISLKFLMPIDSVEIVKNCRNNAVSRRELTRYLQDYFEVQLDHGGKSSASGGA